MTFEIKDLAGLSAPAERLIKVVSAGLEHYIGRVVSEKKLTLRHPSIDFFRTLGRIPLSVVGRQWHRDENGVASDCAIEKGDWDDEERSAYWKIFYDVATTKLKDWEYEEEYRLILYSSLFDLSVKENRKLTYDFNDLDGVIFGIKTTNEDKLAIFKLIEKKCRTLGRSDFKFYQAYYARETGKIEYTIMPLVKFK